ncbi:PREDICTED: ras-related protein Rab-26 isoform X2 [Hipposideros armiger]|uniref:small monomeric GTPase n=1 Tax=Hipposideros armiger TaxID=186990 RepID=A0A8B7RSP1_HIPAR|nr:PREDICTED: ras-related protein Rab-26 isoform X2 [Hipposideros armiger]
MPGDSQFQVQSWPGIACLSPSLPTWEPPARGWHWAPCWSWLVVFQNKVLDVDGTKVKLQIWDTAGQERFRSVTHAYYRDAHALLLLYDVTNKASFDNIQAWLTEIQEYAQHNVVLMLLGNKVDSAQERVVKREDGEKLAKLFAGVWAAFHGDQCQDRPQRGFGLHSHSKGVEPALHEGPQRAPLPAARLCQEGGPWGLLLQTVNLAGHSHRGSCSEAQAQPSPCKSGLQVSLACHPVVNPRVPISRTPRLSLACHPGGNLQPQS